MANFELPTNFTVGNETQGIEGIGSLFTYAQYATGEFFGIGITALIWLISFGVGAMMNIGRAFASASFIAFVFSVYFVRIGAMSVNIPYILAILTIIGFFWAKGERSQTY